MTDSFDRGDPIAHFHTLYARAKASEVFEPDRAALATADADGAPSVRFVLVRDKGEEGFAFYTDYRSRKAQELDLNPRAALAWHWSSIGVQVRMNGPVSRASAARSDGYWQTRPRGSQTGARASEQSAPLESRSALQARVDEVAAQFADAPIPRPESWGGYVLQPDVIEFWFNRDDRLHDRFVYTRQASGWSVTRLHP